MEWTLLIIGLVVGFVLGVGTAFFLRIIQAKNAATLAQELFSQSETLRRAEMLGMIEHLRLVFGDLSFDALSKANEELLKLAKERLESQTQANALELDVKKSLIDRRLEEMSGELEKVASLIIDLERERAGQVGELSSQIKLASEQTAALAQTTGLLQTALANPRARGQWGERMAEDVLRLAGFQEGINYERQKVIEGSGSRPDYTFMLPQGFQVNMDVKFPFENYLRYLEAGSEAEKERCKLAFLRDVRGRISEVTTREYINLTQNTVDYILLFIPNEQIYSFIHEQDNTMLDVGLKNKVILCSPLTLFAILAVMRHAIEAFALDQASNEVLALLGKFREQWAEYLKKMELMGKRLGEAQKEYDSLVTTRQKELERPLERLEELRNLRELPVARYDRGGKVVPIKRAKRPRKLLAPPDLIN